MPGPVIYTKDSRCHGLFMAPVGLLFINKYQMYLEYPMIALCSMSHASGSLDLITTTRLRRGNAYRDGSPGNEIVT